MTAQHTAGPWRYDPEWALIVGPNDEEIAACHAAQEYEEKRQEAQIRLTSAIGQLSALLNIITANTPKI